MIYLLITKLLREMSQSGMCFYFFLQWMSTDFRNLHDAPGALHQHYASMCFVGGRKLGRRFDRKNYLFRQNTYLQNKKHMLTCQGGDWLL